MKYTHELKSARYVYSLWMEQCIITWMAWHNEAIITRNSSIKRSKTNFEMVIQQN